MKTANEIRQEELEKSIIKWRKVLCKEHRTQSFDYLINYLYKGLSSERNRIYQMSVEMAVIEENKLAVKNEREEVEKQK